MKRTAREWETREESIGGDFWASYSDLMAGLLMVFILMTSIAEIAVSRSQDELRDLLNEKTTELQAWNQAIDELCKNDELKTQGVSIDCNTGAISLPNRVLFDTGSDELKRGGEIVLRNVIPTILARLEADGRFWNRIDKIEVLGHADPKVAAGHPYSVNLQLSQARAFTVLKFLTEDGEMPVSHRRNMHEKAVAAGAADTRPPVDCPTRTEACYDQWRRVEIHVDFSDSDYRSELNDVLSRVLDMVGRGD